MHKMRIAILFCLVGILAPAAALCQSSTMSDQRPEESTTSGTITSSTRNTMVVKADSGRYILFVFDRDAARPRVLPVGTRVTVTSTPGDEPGVRIASTVTTPEGTPPSNATATARRGTTTPADEQPIPPELRRIERQIERQTRKYNVGVRAGAALDPELFLVGVHAKFGPIFHPDVSFRPNAEIGFGEVTTQIGLNLEAVYRLPLNVRSDRWSAYIGAGPGFALSHRNFAEAQSGGRTIDFGEFDWHTGLNVLTGIEYRSGMFVEFKTAAYATPHFRMMIGYNF
jgi:hypothetical protein